MKSIILSLVLLICSGSVHANPGKPKELDQFLDKVAMTLLQKNWEGFIALCAAENYQHQKEMGIGDAQYIYEILHFDAELPAVPYENAVSDFMQKLQTISVEDKKVKYDKKKKEYIVRGEYIMRDGLIGEFYFYVRKQENGLKIIGAVG